MNQTVHYNTCSVCVIMYNVLIYYVLSELILWYQLTHKKFESSIKFWKQLFVPMYNTTSYVDNRQS